MRRISMVLFIAALLVGASKLTAEAAAPLGLWQVHTLQCDFKRMTKPDNGMAGVAHLQLSGEKLRWFESTALLSPKTNPPYDGLKYKILERNEVGIVAVLSYTDRYEGIGPVLGANVLTIRKSDGALRVGTVSADGLRNEIEGKCK